jgi:hypothetical protein
MKQEMKTEKRMKRTKEERKTLISELTLLFSQAYYIFL